MKGKWSGMSERQNLIAALEIIHELLNTTELNLDDMEDDTRVSISNSYEFIAEASHHGYVMGS